MHAFLAAYFDNLTQRLQGGVTFWTCVGFLGQAMFASRFFVQWYVSERRKESVVPVAFWWLSLVGGIITSIYVIRIGAVPLILGTTAPLIVYTRNLILIARRKKEQQGGGVFSPTIIEAPNEGSAPATRLNDIAAPPVDSTRPLTPQENGAAALADSAGRRA